MKTFNQFRKDIDEAAALVTALPKIVSVASKVAPKLPKIAKFASGALKFGSSIPVGLGIANVLQSTGGGESNFENLRKQQQAGKGEKLKKKSEEDAEKPSTREKIKNALVDASLNYRKGLSAGKEVESTSSTGRISSTSASDEFRKKEGGKSPAQIARELIQKQKEQYKKQRERNRKNELP